MLSILNLIFPTQCSGCGKKGNPFCQKCLTAIQASSVSGYKFAVTALGSFDGAWAKAIVDFKDHSLIALGPYLAKPMINFLSSRDWQGVIFVHPPRNHKNFRKRGFDPTGLILRRAVGGKAPIVQLQASRMVKDQRSLGAQKRTENIHGAFKAPDLHGKRIFLFDDVITTGATMNEMARAVTQMGGEIIAGCVLAQRNLVFSHAETV